MAADVESVRKRKKLLILLRTCQNKQWTDYRAATFIRICLVKIIGAIADGSLYRNEIKCYIMSVSYVQLTGFENGLSVDCIFMSDSLVPQLCHPGKCHLSRSSLKSRNYHVWKFIFINSPPSDNQRRFNDAAFRNTVR